jgi:hypothetical protein
MILNSAFKPEGHGPVELEYLIFLNEGIFYSAACAFVILNRSFSLTASPPIGTFPRLFR